LIADANCLDERDERYDWTAFAPVFALLIFFSVRKMTPLHRAALKGHVAVSELLLSKKADFMARDYM
jgi:hypothetical protein